MSILFMGTPDWAVPTLEALVDSDYEVCAVLTQPDRPAGRKKRMQASAVKQWAIDHELMVHTPENAGSPQTLELLKNIEADLYLVCAYGQILPQSVLDLPKRVVSICISQNYPNGGVRALCRLRFWQVTPPLESACSGWC